MVLFLVESRVWGSVGFFVPQNYMIYFKKRPTCSTTALLSTVWGLKE